MTSTNLHSLLSSKYDRTACTAGIVHVGPGAFHRAHQAYYVDAMMEKTGDLSWGIAAVNLRAVDRDYLNSLKQSTDGYVLKSVKGSGEAEFRLVRSILSYSDWSEDAEGAENLLALPSIKMVTMTVTESGYYFNENNRLNHLDSLIKSEIEDNRKLSVYAYLRAGLKRRSAANVGPLSILCCDNLRSNGKILKQNFYDYLKAFNDLELIEWLEKNASFPSSMVDRITPKPGSGTRDQVSQLFDRPNDPSVLSEDFVQWVIEDNFVATRPPLEKVGVQIVESVEPYEETKIRVLNGGHTCLSYLGVLRGYKTFDQTINDPILLKHFLAYENNEVLPVLPQDLPFDRYEYLEIITSRFKNSYVADALPRICMDGVSKFSIYILPTVVGCFENGIVPNHAIISIASWYVFAKRIYDSVLSFDYIEPNMQILEPLLKDGRKSDFTEAKSLWGNLPQNFPEFSTVLSREIDILNDEYSLSP